MGLDKKFTDRAYLIGRAVAYVEQAVEVPAGFVGLVATSPLGKLPYHLREALKKGGGGEELVDVASMLGDLPATLTAPEQSRLWVGYYHQRHAIAEDGERKRIGEMIRNAREEKGLSQKTLGERCGVTQAHIARLETGKYAMRTDILSRIADVLGLQIGFTEVE